MKFLPLALLALIVVGLALGCTASPEQGDEDLSPETETETMNNVESTLIDDYSVVEIGNMI